MAANLLFDDSSNDDDYLRDANIYSSARGGNHNRVSRKDVRIRCGEKSFHVHRALLTTCSGKFKQMSEDVDPNRVWQINLVNVSANMMRPLLQYIYKRSQHIFLDLTTDALFPLLSLAHSMEIEIAETSIFGAVLQKSATCSTLAYLWDLACDYNNFSALKEIVQYIHTHIKMMIAEGFFRAIRWDQLHLLMAHCFCDDDRPIANLCTAIVQWLKVEPERKDNYSQSIARSLKWKRLSKDEITELIRKEPLFRTILKLAIHNGIWFPPPPVRQSLILAGTQKRGIHSLLNPQKRRRIVSNIPTSLQKRESDVMASYLMAWRRNVHVPLVYPRGIKPNYGKRALIVLGQTRNNSMAIQFFFPDRNEWTLPYETAMVFHSEAVCFCRNEEFFVIGGKYSNGAIMDQCFVFDISKLQLTKFNDLRHPRAEHGMAIFGKYLYLIGGVNWTKESLSAVLKMPLDENFHMWRPLKSLRCKCASPGIAIDPNGVIFVIGGNTCNCESYEVKNDVWMDLVSLPDDFRNHGMHAVHLNDQVYAFRSFAPMEVCIFNPATNELCVMRTSGPNPRQIVKVVAIECWFWVLDKDGCLFLFDPHSCAWFKTKVKRKYMVKIIQMDTVQPQYLDLASRLLVAS